MTSNSITSDSKWFSPRTLIICLNLCSPPSISFYFDFVPLHTYSIFDSFVLKIGQGSGTRQIPEHETVTKNAQILKPIAQLTSYT